MRTALAVCLVAAFAPIAAAGVLKLGPPPEESAVVTTGRAPCGIAVHAGSLWVGVYEAGELLRLDPQGRVRRSIPVGPFACRVAGAGAVVWVTRDRASEIVRVNIRTGRVHRVAVDAMPFDVMLAAGALWVTAYEEGIVSRLDPRSGRLLARVRVGPRPAGMAFCRGRVWVGHGRSATWLTSIDPATLETRRVDVTAEAPGWPHCIGGALWVTTPDSVARIDASGRLATLLGIGETLGHAAAGPDGVVWVTDKQHSVVHRITPDGRLVLDSFPAGPGAFALARVGASMWVTSFAGADVRRYTP